MKLRERCWSGYSTEATLSILVAAILCAPHLAGAQVVISEIMYNPHGSDSGREWVELYNAGGSDVSMIGGTVKGSWRISDSSNHTLSDPSGGIGRGSLTIPSHGYLVISNDPSAFLADYPAGSFSVIKSSISFNNTGGSISIIDGNGTTLDSASYSKDKGAYDDGSSLQKQSSGAWIAAEPTPGAGNSSTAFTPPPSDTPAESGSQNATDDSLSAEPNSAQLYVPLTPTLFADGGGDRSAIVGADAEFKGRAYDKKQDDVSSTARFVWNFGDGATAEGQVVLHHFDYPGTYQVILTVADALVSASDQLVVTAEPASLAFALLQDGGISIANGGTHSVDISDWIVQQGTSRFVLPAHSVVRAGSSMRVSPATLKFSAGSDVLLLYPNGTKAFAPGQENTDAAVQLGNDNGTAPAVGSAKAPTSAAPESGAAEKKSSADDARIAPDADVAIEESGADVVADDLATSSSQVAAAATLFGGNALVWWGGAAALCLAGAAALFVARASARKEWEIVEGNAE